MSKPELLAIIPARLGSKGIRGKNVRALGGKPLFAHTVEAVTASGIADRLVVSTDDPLVRRWARARAIEVVDRSEMTGGDDATIADVAAEVVEHLGWSGVVGVFQVTSPLRTAASIVGAWSRFVAERPDSLMSVVREPHLYWFDGGDGAAPRPLFEARVNRQFATHKVLRETGSIQFVESRVLRETRGMVGERHLLFEVPAREGLDIDTFDDLAAARAHFDRGTVVFRLTANRVVGSGHLHHCLQLAQELQDQQVVFLLRDSDEFAHAAVADAGHDFFVESNLVEALREIAVEGPRVLVNDVLDTQDSDVLLPKALGYAVVNIEDLGPGARYADAVINALYAVKNLESDRQLVGTRFATLRPEFRYLEERTIREVPRRVLLTFGGTDPSGLSARFARALSCIDVELVVVLGPASPDVAFPDNVTVLRGVASMAEELLEADVVITSAGRTVFEAAATGTPVVVVAQNAREATHSHLGYEMGVMFLGIGALVADEDLVRVVTQLLGDLPLRRELSGRLRASIDDFGAERVAEIIRAQLLSGSWDVKDEF